MRWQDSCFRPRGEGKAAMGNVLRGAWGSARCRTRKTGRTVKVSLTSPQGRHSEATRERGRGGDGSGV